MAPFRSTRLHTVALCALATASLTGSALGPTGLYLIGKEESQILFFPSMTVAAACLMLLAFCEDDLLSVDAARMASRRVQ